MISNRGPNVDTVHPGPTAPGPLQRTTLLVLDPDGQHRFEESERRYKERLVENKRSHSPERRCDLSDCGKLSKAHLLELGTETGLVCIRTGPPFERKYNATDIVAPIPPLQKNILSTFASATVDVRRADAPDVLLVVGWVYHPVLRPLAHDTDRSCDAAAVVVVVLQEFLQGDVGRMVRDVKMRYSGESSGSASSGRVAYGNHAWM
ncbi:hypothetical protein EDB86DRAFT_2828642 [Lactarius hatsudake]|nr:hypothetical protein EDB86DRAFT_2828642 [Lactarius hatsudake]